MNPTRSTRKVSGRVPRWLAAGARLTRDTGSMVAVEFALIGTAFFLFVFGIFMVAMVQYWQMTLDDATRNTARGVALGSINSYSSFVASICGEFALTAANCSNTLQFDVQVEPYFSSPSQSISPASLNANGNLSTALTASGAWNFTSTTLAGAAVGSGQAATAGVENMLLVQVVYPLPIFIPLLGGAFTENGTHSLYSAVATAME